MKAIYATLKILFLFAILSCSKNSCNTITPSSNEGYVKFWTKNQAKLTACGGSLKIVISYNGALFDSVNITGVYTSEPGVCDNTNGGYRPNLLASNSYFYSGPDNNCNRVAPFATFTISSSSCRIIEIP